jgi:hypothetical protein
LAHQAGAPAAEPRRDAAPPLPAVPQQAPAGDLEETFLGPLTRQIGTIPGPTIRVPGATRDPGIALGTGGLAAATDVAPDLLSADGEPAPRRERAGEATRSAAVAGPQPRRVTPSVAAPIATVSLRSAPADAPSRRRQETAAPQTTVSVTIGRVEVRALPAASTPAREARLPAPRMTLEDYQRKIDGGAR